MAHTEAMPQPAPAPTWLPDGVVFESNIGYGVDPKQVIDVFHEEGAKESAVFVMVHGG